MLDLAQPLGPVEGLTLYGDHLDPSLVYYLPDEVKLAVDGDRPAMSLQIFFPDEAVAGDAGDLRDSVGALLELGVTCDVDAARLERAREGVQARRGRDDVRLSPPPWEDGRIELLLDAVSGAVGELDRDAMVAAVVGSRRPSLQDGRLAGLFHARLDRRGTALVDAALRGGLGTVAGVLYDVQFAALRPTLDMRIRADLDRVADFIRASLGVQTAYVGLELGFAWEDMKEQGIVEVTVTSLLDTAEAQRAADEVVKDFQDTVMRELFRPMVPPLAALASATAAPQGSMFKIGASWGHSEQTRVIEIDYSKRQATRRSHNPQSHLYGMAAAAGDPDRFIQRVPLGAAWRERALEIAAPQAFADPQLRQLAVAVWRGRDGVLPAGEAREDGLRMPADAHALADVGFTAEQAGPRRVAWVADPDEPPFYHWQARATWAPDDDVDSPAVLWSEPQASSSQDLDLFPSLLLPTRAVRWSLGEGLPADLSLVTLRAVARDASGTELATRLVSLAPGARAEQRWGVRRASTTAIEIDAAPTFHFEDGRRLERPAVRVIDPEVTILSPFVATRAIAMLVTGATPGVERIVVTFRYRDEAAGYAHEVVRTLAPPEFRAEDVRVPVLRADAEIEWEAERIDATGEVRRIAGGRTVKSIVIPAQGASRTVKLTWVGPALPDAGLTRLVVTVRARAESGEELERQVETYRGSAVPEARTVVIAAPDGTLEAAIARRFTDGHEETEPFRRIEAGEVLIAP